MTACVDVSHIVDSSGVGIRLLSRDDPADLRALEVLLHQCHRQDLIFRFGHCVPSLRTARLLLPRSAGDIALGAVTRAGAIVGVLNLNVVPAEEREIGLLVAPEWRRRGLARALIAAGVGQASAYTGIIDASNQPALKLLAAIAPAAQRLFESHTVTFRVQVHERSRVGGRVSMQAAGHPTLEGAAPRAYL